MKLIQIQKYKVVDFVAYHNHPFQPRNYVHMICSHWCIYKAQTSQIVLGVKSGLRLSKQVGGIKPAGFTRQDLKNYIVTKRM